MNVFIFESIVHGLAGDFWVSSLTVPWTLFLNGTSEVNLVPFEISAFAAPFQLFLCEITRILTLAWTSRIAGTIEQGSAEEHGDDHPAPVTGQPGA